MGVTIVRTEKPRPPAKPVGVKIIGPAMRDPSDGACYYAQAQHTHDDVLASLRDKFPGRSFNDWQLGWVDVRLRFVAGDQPKPVVSDDEHFEQPIL